MDIASGVGRVKLEVIRKLLRHPVLLFSCQTGKHEMVILALRDTLLDATLVFLPLFFSPPFSV